ncbi:hypothetical protein D364_12185 [Klebsiella pneumoniae CG43]|nr:hypothetical protein D364_12185 [Klebsiella pneumoniae CG43]
MIIIFIFCCRRFYQEEYIFLFGINYAKDPFFRDIKRAMWLSGARWVAI